MVTFKRVVSLALGLAVLAALTVLIGTHATVASPGLNHVAAAVLNFRHRNRISRECPVICANVRGRMEPQLHPPFDQQRASLANLLFGSEHRHTLYLACFGELFAFSLSERFVNQGLAILGQVQ